MWLSVSRDLRFRWLSRHRGCDFLSDGWVCVLSVWFSALALIFVGHPAGSHFFRLQMMKKSVFATLPRRVLKKIRAVRCVFVWAFSLNSITLIVSTFLCVFGRHCNFDSSPSNFARPTFGPASHACRFFGPAFVAFGVPTFLRAKLLRSLLSRRFCGQNCGIC